MGSEGYLVSFKLETDPKLLIPRRSARCSGTGTSWSSGTISTGASSRWCFVERKAHSPQEAHETGPTRPSDEIQVDGQQFTATWMRLVDSNASQNDSIEGGGKGGEKELEEDIIANCVEGMIRDRKVDFGCFV